jgi:Transmembrane protein 231
VRGAGRGAREGGREGSGVRSRRAGLWRVHDWHWEQPEVEWQEEVLVVVDVARSLAGGSVRTAQLSWASRQEACGLLPGETRPATVRARAEDDFGDGRPDRLFLRVSVPLADSEVATGASLVTRLVARLHDRAALEFDSLLTVSSRSGAPGRGLTAVGELRLLQRSPVPVAGGYWAPYLNEPVWDLAGAESSADLDLAALEKRNAARNFSLVLQGASPVWHTEADFRPVAPDATAFDTGFEALAARPRSFDFEVVAHVPRQHVWILPALSTVLKAAWVQYVALFAPIFLALWALVAALFDTGAIFANADADRVVRSKIA